MHYKIFVFLYAILPGSLQRDDLKALEAKRNNIFLDCKTFTSYGYGYREAHEYRGANIPQNYVFLLDFYVKTVSDAHVLLQSDRSGSDSIEIVIGGGSNTFSQIRWLVYDEKRTILTQKTENILSPDNYRKFQITADTQGVLTVRAGDDEFLSWKFEKLFPIKYFAFGSWTNTKGTWKYGCNHQTDFTDTEIFTTDLERLKKDLLTFYNPNTIPCNSSETLEIQVRFHMHTVSLNESRGELIIRGESMLKWHDAKLKWKPDDYGGINTLYLPPFQVWTPPLKTLNVLAIHKDYLLSETEAGLLVRQNGSIFWRPPFKSVSMCQVSISSYPKDIHTCSVYIGFWMEPKNLKLTIINPNEKVELSRVLEIRVSFFVVNGNRKFQMENVRTGTVWRILKATAVKGRDEEGNDNYGVLYVELQRHVYLITEEVINGMLKVLMNIFNV
ncbi:hypothetical protein RUM44_012870 [Polyplax serrata]|uniref:Uncharacterized protein n=1 Tax=Polyplax serrata TaxID=468196 RepID=A0ABR1BCI2_POLSC